VLITQVLDVIRNATDSFPNRFTGPWVWRNDGHCNREP